MKGKLMLGRVIALTLLLGAAAPGFAQRDHNDGSKARAEARDRGAQRQGRAEPAREARGEERRDDNREEQRGRQERGNAPAPRGVSGHVAPTPAPQAAQPDRRLQDRSGNVPPAARVQSQPQARPSQPAQAPSRPAPTRQQQPPPPRQAAPARGNDAIRGQAQGARPDPRAAQSDRRASPPDRRGNQNVRSAPPPRAARRLSDREHQRLVSEQRSHADRYRQNLNQRLQQDRRRSEQLRQQRREQQYRYQQRYWERQRAFQVQWSTRRYDYSHPFFYTAPSYRYVRAGRWYEVNQYAADVLREAVRLGYEEGYYAGEADRYDGWRGGYQDNFVYQDANLGYDGYYVSQAEYNWYFREGFRRGYEDGYGRAARYGYVEGDRHSILPAVLAAILVLEALD